MEKQKKYYIHLIAIDSDGQKMTNDENSGLIEEKSTTGFYSNEWHQEYQLIYQSYITDAG